MYGFVELTEEAKVFALGSAPCVMGVFADLFAFFFGDAEGDACVFLSGAFCGFVGVCHRLYIGGCFGCYFNVFAVFSFDFGWFLKFICNGFLEKRMPDEGFWIYVFCMENRVFESFSARSFWCFAADAHGFFRGFGCLNPSIIGMGMSYDIK